MYYYSESFKTDAIFESAGMFVTDKPWCHSKRTMSSYEIILLLEGELPIEVNNQRYLVKKNESLVVPPFVPHKGYADTPSSARFLWFHFNFGSNTLNKLKNLELLNEENALEHKTEILLLPTYSDKMDMHRILLMTNQLLDVYQERVPQDYLNAYLNSILHEITYQTVKNARQEKMTKNDMQPIQDWIRVHAFEDISLQDIADYFSYNKNYLSRKYKETLGIGISNQIIKFRLERSKFLLSDTNRTIQEIANLVGYEDPKYFMRIFKKMENNTPSGYRKAFQKKHFNNI